MYANKVNGYTKAGESLGSNLDFFTLTVTAATMSILPLDAGGDATSQARLDKVVEVISLKGQPVIMAAPYLSGSDHVFKFAIEHAGAWTAADLKAAIIEHQNSGMGFTSAIAVTTSSTL